MKEFKSKFKTYRIKTAFYKTGKSTTVKYVSANTISYLYIWYQTRHKQNTTIQSF